MQSDAVLQKPGNKEKLVPPPPFRTFECRNEASHAFPENNMNNKEKSMVSLQAKLY